jgi:hypothetical protein
MIDTAASAAPNDLRDIENDFRPGIERFCVESLIRMRKIKVAGLIAVAFLASLQVANASASSHEPVTTIALIDTGLNPYHPAFRDNGPLAFVHPSEYLPGYPTTARALPLTLNAESLQQALQMDADIWATVVQTELYWVPGTRIVGLISMGSGGAQCENGLPNIPPAGGTLRQQGCVDRKNLDDQGHGTMTASRAAGIGSSLSPTSRIVMIEGLGDAGVTWASMRPWIDVQSNSWGSIAPGTNYRRAIENAAAKHLVVFASGNGTAFSGVAPTPTATHATRGRGAVQVGAHDNGNISAWSDAPAHIVADGYGGIAAPHDSLAPVAPMPISCCTSAAAPYAAGAAARILRNARALLNDPTPGILQRTGAPALVASGTPVLGSPMLGDGEFDLSEWRQLLLATANPRPVLGPHDGLMNFMGGPFAPQHPEYGPGENPFCLMCTTMPIAWSQVPIEAPAYASIGYGSVDPATVDLASAVLRGDASIPDRSSEDEFFAVEDPIGSFRP